MNSVIKGKVIKGVGGTFTVAYGDGFLVKCRARKKTRYAGEIVYVGDCVEIEIEGESGTIERVLPRRNRLPRPYVANIDYAIIVLSTIPMADFMLVDKLLVSCAIENITPIIAVNKTDVVENDFIDYVVSQYDGVVAKIFALSALNGDGVAALRDFIRGKTVCFVGQSAVGKTSLLNCFTETKGETGELSKKIMRGKHTTRHNELFDIGDNTYIADTAGFSVLEEPSVKADELCLYCHDLFEYSKDCRFNMCTHIGEPDCAVKDAVKAGKLNAERYERYVALYNEIKETERNRY